MPETLIPELEYFDKNRRAWLQNAFGKFAVVKGSELLGFFDTDEAAFQAAVRAFGMEPVLIKQVLPEDLVQHVPALTCGVLDADL